MRGGVLENRPALVPGVRGAMRLLMTKAQQALMPFDDYRVY